MKRVIFVILISLFLGNVIWPQSPEIDINKIDSILDEILFKKPKIKNPSPIAHLLYWGTSYDNKTFYAGREVGVGQYSISGQLFYFNSLGFYIGGGGAWYSQLDPRYNNTIISAGYSNSLPNHKSLRYRASYSRFFFSNNDYDPTYTGSINAGSTYQTDWIGTRLDYSLHTGNAYSSQISWDVYSKITLLKFGTFNKIRFEPEISLFFGSETVEYERYSFLTQSDKNPAIYKVTDEIFGLMNTQIRLPLDITYKGFDIELGYNINLPYSHNNSITYDNTGYFSVSLGYALSIF